MPNIDPKTSTWIVILILTKI